MTDLERLFEWTELLDDDGLACLVEVAAVLAADQIGAHSASICSPAGAPRPLSLTATHCSQDEVEQQRLPLAMISVGRGKEVDRSQRQQLTLCLINARVVLDPEVEQPLQPDEADAARLLLARLSHGI